MQAWWERIGTYNQILFVIALATTIFLGLQLIILVFGFASDSAFDGDAEFDADGGIDDINDGSAFEIFGLKLLTVRSLTAFLGVGCWVTYTFNLIMGIKFWYLATLIGAVCGFAAAAAIAIALEAFMKLQTSGTVELSSCVGKVGEVYLSIPPQKKGTGKVNVNMTERVMEFEAMTANEEPIPTGSPIRVIGLVGSNLLLVEPLA